MRLLPWPVGAGHQLRDKRWRWIVALVVIAGVALIVRCYRLGLPGLTNDEAFSWRMTLYEGQGLLGRIRSDVHPPLYYLLLKTWVNVWGTSPVSLRSLSVALGLLCVPLLHALCVEGARLAKPEISPARAHGGALFSAFLLAIHGAQFSPSRTARMYSLGVFLAGLTAWLLLRALQARGRSEVWWCGYTVAVAGFCYTHYYAFFTICAQALFMFAYLIRGALKSGIRKTAPSATGFILATMLALLLYSPWVPVLMYQIEQVRTGFWIPAVSASEATHVFIWWGTGLKDQSALDSGLWLTLVIALTSWTVWRAKQAGWFFLLQAALPWVFSLAISYCSGMSIFYDRYLVFAQFFLLGFWGIAWASLAAWRERLAVGCLLGAVSVAGLWITIRRLPATQPPLMKAAEFLQERYRAGDLILTNGPAAVNRLRYYAKQAGIKAINVRCWQSSFPGTGQLVHLASLRTEDVVWPGEKGRVESARRRWLLFDNGDQVSNPPEGMAIILERTFEAEDAFPCFLVLYEREQ